MTESISTSTPTTNAYDGWKRDDVVQLINFAISRQFNANPSAADVVRMVDAFAQCGTFDYDQVRAELMERWGLASTNDDDTLNANECEQCGCAAWAWRGAAGWLCPAHAGVLDEYRAEDTDTLTTDEVKPCHGWVIDNGEDDYAFGIEIAEADAARVADAERAI